MPERSWLGSAAVRGANGLAATATQVRHAKALLNAAVRAGAREDACHAVSSHIKVRSRNSMAGSRAHALRLRARVAFLKGDAGRARADLTASSALFEQAGASDQAARDRYALGALTGGPPGAELRRAALARLRELDLLSSERNLEAYFPELVG